MSSPSYTYTLTNGTTADASQVMQDFTDILNGITDGTKDLSISALTCAGTATFNGNVAIGNASGDDLTITASLASSVVPKTDATYNIGSSTFGLARVYLGRNSHRVGLIPDSATASDFDITLPLTTGQLANWVTGMEVTRNAITASYSILDADKYLMIDVTTAPSTITFSSRSSDTVTMTGSHGMITGATLLFNGGGTICTGLTAATLYYAIVTGATTLKFATTMSNAIAGTAVTLSGDGSGARTWAPGVGVKLPAPANNTNRRIVIKKTDSGTEWVTVVPNVTETVDGLGYYALVAQTEFVELLCNGTNWVVMGSAGGYLETQVVSPVNAASSTNYKAVAARLLPPGNWLISGIAQFNKAAATLVANADIIANINDTAASGSGTGFGYDRIAGGQTAVGTSAYLALSIPAKKVSNTVDTTFYVNGYCEFSSGTPTWTGSVMARRL